MPANRPCPTSRSSASEGWPGAPMWAKNFQHWCCELHCCQECPLDGIPNPLLPDHRCLASRWTCRCRLCDLHLLLGWLHAPTLWGPIRHWFRLRRAPLSVCPALTRRTHPVDWEFRRKPAQVWRQTKVWSRDGVTNGFLLQNMLTKKHFWHAHTPQSPWPWTIKKYHATFCKSSRISNVCRRFSSGLESIRVDFGGLIHSQFPCASNDSLAGTSHSFFATR